MSRTDDYWTNESVKALIAGTNRDPTEVITDKAVRVSLTAMEHGWSGPPFDPFSLADFLKVRVVPREDIADARTVPSGTGLTIEFNPNRPRARVRYSICHELAHTLFPDCRDRVRHRLTHATMKGDDWQLEMLCNLAAAEFAMPLGSLPRVNDSQLYIDRVLELRQRYEVSAEAMLLRLVKLTEHQCMFFCASRVSDAESTGARYAENYVKASKAWRISIAPGAVLPPDTAAGECTAIGYTAKGQEEWTGVGRVRVECVGVSPYPNNMWPRVVGLLKPLRQTGAHVPTITYIRGDAIEPRGKGNKLLVQVVNDAALTWGAGFSLAVRKKWPALQQGFRSWAMERRNLALGNIHLAEIDASLSLVSLVAQHGYGPSPRARIRYSALQECLRKVAILASEGRAIVHMPRIGCGLAGGSWDVVSELVDETLCARGIDVSVYDLPGKQAQGHPQAEIQFSGTV